jgi:antitoxin ParD1/3/4
MAQNVKTRNVSLTPEIEAFINDRVASGRFRSASEVVRAAMRLLEDDERRREQPVQRSSRSPRRIQPNANLLE